MLVVVILLNVLLIGVVVVRIGLMLWSGGHLLPEDVRSTRSQDEGNR